MATKARNTLQEAKALHAGTPPLLEGAASRAYYCIYQAFCPVLKKFYVTTTKLAKVLKDKRQFGDRWIHEHIPQIAPQYLGAANADLVETALELRVRADYGSDPVTPEELQPVMEGLETIVSTLEKK